MRHSRLHRGLKADLPSSLSYGEVYFCTDTLQVYLGLANNSVVEVRDKQVLQEISNIKGDITSKNNDLISKINALTTTVNNNKSDGDNKHNALAQTVADNKTAIDNKVNDLTGVVNANKSAIEHTVSELTGTVNANKTDANNKINALTGTVNANKSDADNKHNSLTQTVTDNREYGERTYVKRADYLNGDIDFNNVTTPGMYYVIGGNHANKPPTLANSKGGMLIVSSYATNTKGIIQTFTDEVHGVISTRVLPYGTSTWGSWNTHYSVNSKPTPNDLGAYTKNEVDTRDTNTLNSAKSYTNSEVAKKLSLTGGTLTGKLRVVTENGQIEAQKGDNIAVFGTSATAGEYLFGGRLSSYTNDFVQTYMRIGTNKLQYFNGSSTYDIYHTGHKPSASDVGARPASWVPSWNDVTGKPSTFPPSSHNHDSAYLGKTATATNSDKLFGYGRYLGQSQGGSFGIPVVGQDGVIEIGHFIDFHLPNSSKDFDARMNLSDDAQSILFNNKQMLLKGQTVPSDIGALANSDVSSEYDANKVVRRNGDGDIQGRLFRANYQDDSYMNGALAFRTSSNGDNYTRYCNNPIAVNDWLGSSTGRGRLDVGVDLNTITKNGVYELNEISKSPNGIQGLYDWGVLVVLNSTARMAQIYYPHLTQNNNGIPYIRVRNADIWTPWRPFTQGLNWNDVQGKPSTFPPSDHNHDSSYVKFSGGTMSGNLIVANSGVPTIGARNTSTGDSILNLERQGSTASSWRLRNSSGILYFEADYLDSRGKGDYYTGAKLEYNNGNFTTKGEIYANNGSRVYHTGNKPSWNDVQGKPSTFAPSSHDHPYLAWGNNLIDCRQPNDFAGLAKPNNVNIETWYGFSITNRCASDIPAGGVAFSVNARNGMVWAKGDIYARGDQRVYHTGFKPSPSDIGASPSNHNHNGTYLKQVIGATNESYVLDKKFIEIGDSSTKVNVGRGSTDVYVQNTVSNKYFALKDDGRLLYNDMNVTLDDPNTVLWKGYHHMTKSETVTPSKLLNKCSRGWVLVWSDWDDGGTGNNFNINYTYIPKNTMFNTGTNTCFALSCGESSNAFANKTLYIFNDKITGHDSNKDKANNPNSYDIVLRAVLEY